mgnify:CR=1 FL=1
MHLDLLHQYVWADSTLVAVSDGTPNANAWRNVYTDHLGTPRAITDQSGTVIWRWPWQDNAFGEQPAEQDPDGNGTDFDFNLRFPGQYFDAETGLHYNYFRDYEPGTGRFVESDPIGIEAEVNTFLYAQGGPLNKVDPSGLDTLVIVGGPSNGNPAGHVAIAFTGRGIYSYGTAELPGTSATAYLEHQGSYRSSIAYRIATTGEQESIMRKIMLSFEGKRLPDPFTDPVSAMGDTCATRVAEALDAGNIGVPFFMPRGPSFLPGSVGMNAAWNASSVYILTKGASIPASLDSFNP